MPTIALTDAEVEFLIALVDEECNYWQTNIESDRDRQVAIVAGAIWNKLHGDGADAAELEARRRVDAWLAENAALGGL